MENMKVSRTGRGAISRNGSPLLFTKSFKWSLGKSFWSHDKEEEEDIHSLFLPSHIGCLTSAAAANFLMERSVELWEEKLNFLLLERSHCRYEHFSQRTLTYKGKYHFTTDLLSDKSGFNQTTKAVAS